MFDQAMTSAPNRAARVEQELRTVVAALDPESVPLSEVPELWNCLDRIERLASGAKTLLARRVEESGIWRREGHQPGALVRPQERHLARAGQEPAGDLQADQ